MKIGVVVLTLIVSTVLLLPSFLGEEATPDWLPGKRLNLGLDLQGGIHVVLGVDIQKALDVELDHLSQQLSSALEDQEINGVNIERAETGRSLLVNLREPQQAKLIEKVLRDEFYKILVLSNYESDQVMRVRMESSHEDQIQLLSLEQAREIIRNRVDEFGVAEPIIQIEGSDRILVQLPGVKDPDRAIQLIGKTALLEYKIVDESMNVGQLDSMVESVRADVGFTNNFTRSQLNALNEALKDQLPKGTEISFQKDRDPRSDETMITPFLLRADTVLTGQALEDARVTTNPTNNQPQVSLTFNRQGAEDFERITGANVGKRLAILLDGVVISDPYIREKIPAISRGATITLGQGSRRQLLEEAKDLSLVLRSGALPAPVEILENRTVGASLGQDSIDKGKFTGMVAGIVVILFMLVYYRFSGLVADLAVGVNLVMLLAIMAFFQATLTLPGIAGIVLTIGMAVDANVIILERIREEISKGGRKTRAAIETGYEAAHKAILDANVTTAIAGIVLFNFGSGPIRGFAVTLMIGIICSYISAVWFSRWIMTWAVERFGMKQLSI